MFAEELRRAAEAAPRARLHEVSSALWKAFAAGGVTEQEAEQLSLLIEARKTSQDPGITGSSPPSRRVGSRPRTDASMERRRRWAAAGLMPPQVAARLTLAEAAVMAVIASETIRHGACRLCQEAVAAIAGVSKSTVRAALRQARRFGLITIEERRVSAWRNLPNVVRIELREWASWLRLARRSAAPWGGVKSATPTSTGVSTGVSRSSRQRPAETAGRATGGRKAGPPGQNRGTSRIAEAAAGGG